ncbi:hypothetical protein [Pseudalkalibacillus caeni]|uniref:DUF3139 domain-containing protein n=1 Tax=Exobacillus caeni TaxID=2574798 RepID=A0A5R9F407_9BACL|nr:hypothetical protein [Pseudalkalibacillus caeni]TLS37076.1 hypothetical protein FCL54_11130 [Pseudalkalibacillus caeni]
MKKLLLVGSIILLVLVVFSFGPYNIYNEFNEAKALKQFISEDKTFKGLEVIDIDYRGSDTYFIQTKDGGQRRNFIVMNYQSSVMNGHWKVFEETSKGNYY